MTKGLISPFKTFPSPFSLPKIFHFVAIFFLCLKRNQSNSWILIFIIFMGNNFLGIGNITENYSGPHFLAIWLTMESLHIQSECGKIQTRVTPNTGTFHPVKETAYFALRKIFDIEFGLCDQTKKSRIFNSIFKIRLI